MARNKRTKLIGILQKLGVDASDSLSEKRATRRLLRVLKKNPNLNYKELDDISNEDAAILNELLAGEGAEGAEEPTTDTTDSPAAKPKPAKKTKSKPEQTSKRKPRDGGPTKLFREFFSTGKEWKREDLYKAFEEAGYNHITSVCYLACAKRLWQEMTAFGFHLEEITNKTGEKVLRKSSFDPDAPRRTRKTKGIETDKTSRKPKATNRKKKNVLKT
jgi:hypothetical protein